MYGQVGKQSNGMRSKSVRSEDLGIKAWFPCPSSGLHGLFQGGHLQANISSC